MLYVLAEIHSIKKTFVLGSNINIRWKGHDRCTLNYNIHEGTGKVIYKPSILDEEQLHLKQDRSRSHKSVV